MKLIAFLNEGRSQSIDIEKAKDVIKKECSKSYEAYISGKTKIYRGLNSMEKSLFVDPSKSERASANTENYYTLVMDNNSAWDHFPKRSKSIVCTTNIEKAFSYGAAQYLIFPYDGSKIGVCPHSDIWQCTEKYGTDLDGINQIIGWIAEAYNIKIGRFTKKYDLFKKDLGKINDLMKADKEKTEAVIGGTWNNVIKIRYNYKISLLDNFSALLDPVKLRFKLVKAGDPIPDNREVWTDGKCVLIETTYSEVFKI